MSSTTTRVLPVTAAPPACSLDESDRGARRSEWAALRAPARIAEQRTESTLTTTWRRDEHVRSEVERLVAAEHECCPFLGFELTVDEDAITLVTTFPDGISPEAWEW
jgi:hypothetical protein